MFLLVAGKFLTCFLHFTVWLAICVFSQYLDKSHVLFKQQSVLLLPDHL